MEDAERRGIQNDGTCAEKEGKKAATKVHTMVSSLDGGRRDTGCKHRYILCVRSRSDTCELLHSPLGTHFYLLRARGEGKNGLAMQTDSHAAMAASMLVCRDVLLQAGSVSARPAACGVAWALAGRCMESADWLATAETTCRVID